MENQNKVFLLRIVESGKVIAEAPLIIYDEKLAMERFMQVFGQMIPTIPGVVLQAMMAACNSEMLSKVPGPIVAMHIQNQSPLTIPYPPKPEFSKQRR